MSGLGGSALARAGWRPVILGGRGRHRLGNALRQAQQVFIPPRAGTRLHGEQCQPDQVPDGARDVDAAHLGGLRHHLDRWQRGVTALRKLPVVLHDRVQDLAVELAQACRGRCDPIRLSELRFRDEHRSLVHPHGGAAA